METEVKDKSLIEEISAIPGGEGIKVCMQCGTCTASCPNADLMDHTPSELIAMARADMREEVLSSNAMWYCLSCYTCTVRCPRGINQTDLMHALEYLSIRSGLVHAKTLTPTMYRLFNHYCSMGSLSELWFMTRFYLQTNPFRAWRMIPVAFNMLKRGRLSVKTRKLSQGGRSQLQAILDKAESLGGTK
jgi:heterodisulfide reductase subunit C